MLCEKVQCPSKETRTRVARCSVLQVLENSLEARVLQSDNSALAKDCRKEMKALNSRLLKLGASVRLHAGFVVGLCAVCSGWVGQ